MAVFPDVPIFPEATGPTWRGPRTCPGCNGEGLTTDDSGRPRLCPICAGAGLIQQPGGT